MTQDGTRPSGGFPDTLNRFSLGGFPLGFWFAQQGSIVVFVLLILVYGLVLSGEAVAFPLGTPGSLDAW